MIEQNESGDLSVVSSEESFDRIGLDGQSIECAVAEFLVIMGFQVFGAAGRGVGAGDVDSPEVVVLDRDMGEDRIDGILDEFDDSAGILFIDLSSLGSGDTQHAEGGVSIHGETEGA